MGVSALFATTAPYVLVKRGLCFVIHKLELALIKLSYTLWTLIHYRAAILTSVSRVKRGNSWAWRGYIWWLLIPYIRIRVLFLYNIDFSSYPQPHQHTNTDHEYQHQKEAAYGLSQYLDFAMEFFSLFVLATFIMGLLRLLRVFSLLPLTNIFFWYSRFRCRKNFALRRHVWRAWHLSVLHLGRLIRWERDILFWLCEIYFLHFLSHFLLLRENFHLVN